MAKRNKTVSIDSDLLDRASIVIPNVSGFFEEALRERLYEVGNPEELQERIRELEDEIELIRSKLKTAKKAVNKELEEAIEVCINTIKRDGKVPDHVLTYWCTKAQIERDEFASILDRRLREQKVDGNGCNND